MAVDLMRRGLADDLPAVPGRKTKVIISADGVPVVCCAINAPAAQMTAESLVDLELETLTMEDMQRLGLAL